MKKTILILCAAVMLTSCATVAGGKITACQKTKPAGTHRQLRTVPLLCDIFLLSPLALIIDFADGAIYKPCDKK